MQELRTSEAARKIAQLFVLDRLNKRELAVVHPILAALQQVSLCRGLGLSLFSPGNKVPRHQSECVKCLTACRVALSLHSYFCWTS